MVLSGLARALAIATGREARGIEMKMRGLVASRLRGWESVRLGPSVDFVGADRIKLGRGVTLTGFSCLNATGDAGSITIGADTHIDYFAVLYGQGGITIGASCAIAARVTIYSQTNQIPQSATDLIVAAGTRYARVDIGNNVWIGAGAVILPGVSIANNTVIGAGAVVTRDVHEFEIVGGVPARVIGHRDRRAHVNSDEHRS